MWLTHKENKRKYLVVHHLQTKHTHTHKKKKREWKEKERKNTYNTFHYNKYKSTFLISVCDPLRVAGSGAGDVPSHWAIDGAVLFSWAVKVCGWLCDCYSF